VTRGNGEPMKKADMLAHATEERRSRPMRPDSREELQARVDVHPSQSGPYASLRETFERVLTVDSATRDRRRKDWNVAIFAPRERGGYAIWTNTDLDMVLDAFDRAVKRNGQEVR
jgi:hypothetical protein